MCDNPSDKDLDRIFDNCLKIIKDGEIPLRYGIAKYVDEYVIWDCKTNIWYHRTKDETNWHKQ